MIFPEAGYPTEARLFRGRAGRTPILLPGAGWERTAALTGALRRSGSAARIVSRNAWLDCSRAPETSVKANVPCPIGCA